MLLCVFAAAAGEDVEGAVVDLQGAAGAQTVAFRTDVKDAVLDVEIAQRAVLVILRMDAVLARGDGHAGVGDADVVLAGDGMAGGGQVVAAVGDGQFVLGYDSMTGGGGNGQRAGAVDGQVFLGENHRIDVVFVNGKEAAAVGEYIVGVLRQREEHLVRLQDVNGGTGLAVDGGVVQHQLGLVGLFCVDDDHAVVQRAGDHIGAFIKDGNGAAGDLDRIGGAGGAVSVQGDQCAFARIVAAFIVPIGKSGVGIDHGSAAGNAGGGLCGGRGDGSIAVARGRGRTSAAGQQQAEEQNQSEESFFHRGRSFP